MIIDLTNEIDKKLANTFPVDVLEKIKIGVIDYFGINFDEESNDFEFKMYYANRYSKEEYQKYKNIPIINYLFENNMINFLEEVQDNENSNYRRFNIGLKHRNNQNMQNLFSWLEDNVEFFAKYKEEILNFSKMKNFAEEDYDYSSLFYIGFVNSDDGVELLKLYWLNRNHEDSSMEYYVDFINQNGMSGIKKLLPITLSAVENCNGNLYMEGIDYNKDSSSKHKIYVEGPKDLYAGLLKTFSNREGLVEKINLIKDWHEVHSEFYCDGFAICENANNKTVLNMYYKFKK